MSWLLVRLYLTIAILNYVFSNPPNNKKSFVPKNKILRFDWNNPNDKKPPPSYEDGSISFSHEELSGKMETKRGLIVGDTFTPSDMLPIAERLFKKVGEPGYGKGFVSSTYSAQELADKLFEAFFVTTKRIVSLKDSDIPGLDALQALALNGESVNSETEAVTEAAETMYLRGQLIDIKPKRSKYKIVSKVVTLDTKNTSKKPKRRGIELAKKLNKKRHIIINKRRDNRNKLGRNSSGCKQNKGKGTIGLNENGKHVTKASPCRWRYECSNIADLDTCRLGSECPKDKQNTIDAIPVQHKSDEHTLAIIKFRKMLGISAIDEEVEKILESRNLLLRPSNADVIEKVESLAEYFNNIIIQEDLASTKVVPPQGNMTKHILNAKFSDEEVVEKPQRFFLNR